MRAGWWACVAVSIGLSALTGCSSDSNPTVTMVLASQKIAPGKVVTISGALSEHKAGASVQLQSATANGTSFAATGDSASTDGSGAYSIQFTPAAPGKYTLRVAVTDGKKMITSATSSLNVLAATGITAVLRGAGEVALNARASLSGQVTPPAPNRMVTLERSAGADVWVAVGVAAGTDADGRFVLVLPTSIAGWQTVRVSVAETTSQASAASARVRYYVADYKAAGRRYLSCVKQANAAIDIEHKAAVRFDNGEISLAKLDSVEGALGVAMRGEIRCLNSFSWPPSVARLVKDLAAQEAVLADTQASLGKAKSLEDYNAIASSPEQATAVRKSSADAAKIRRALGLPARPQI
jgi:hypothetical protein